MVVVVVVVVGGRDSSVGIATRYGLDGRGIESPVGATFSAPVQTGPGAHPASCTMGTGSFTGVERRGVVLTPNPPSSVPKSQKKGKAMPLPTLRVLVAYKGVNFILTYCIVLW